MATYVNDLRLKEIGTGESSGTWGTETNTNLELIAEAFSFGTEAITTNADTHDTIIADGQSDPGRSMYLKYTGTLDSACTITIAPNTVSKMWFIENGTSGSQNIIISQGSGANITIPPGDVKAIYSDGAGSGAAMIDAFASLNVVDLKVQDDLTVTDDVSIGGALTLTGNADFNGDLDVDGTSNLDVVDIDGAVDMASTLQVDGALTGSSTIQGTTITATTAFVPDASDGAALGTTSLEFSDLFLADAAVINLGADQDTKLTHVADTGILLNSTRQLQFGDSGTYIHQSADGVLDLVSDTELELNATTIDINGNTEIAGTLSLVGSEVLFDNTGGDFTLKLHTNAVGDKNEIIMGDTSTPLAKFGVGGAANDIITGSDGQDFNIGTAGGGRAINFSTDNFGSVEMKLDGGNLGIGNTECSDVLHVTKTGSGAQIALRLANEGTSVGDGPRINFTSGTSSEGSSIKSLGTALNKADLVLNSGGNVETMRMTSDNDVVIGHTAAVGTTHKGKLQVKSAISILDGSNTTAATLSLYSSGANSAFLSVDPDQEGNDTHFYFYIDGSNKMKLDNNGRLSIDPSDTRTATGALNLLGEVGANFAAIAFRHNASTVVGTVVTNASATAYNTSSDYRLKENVDYTWDATTRLKQLKPARFNFIADETNTLVDGFLAHEVSSIVPEAITGAKDAVDSDGNPDYQGIDQSKLVPLLVKTIQELEARITTLEG